ncbi:MAG: sigma-54 dependent transcriptional regulator [Steroidobacteraceae bacterium]
MPEHAVLVVEDDCALREALCDTLMVAGYDVRPAADGATALNVLEREAVDLVVSDVQMQPMDGHALLGLIRARQPNLPVILMTAYGSIRQAVDVMRAGATEYLVKPFEAHALVELIERYSHCSSAGDSLIAVDPRSRELKQLAQRLAQTETSVLLTGESGTGKEVYARFLHQQSRRASGPFVPINCAAIPETMLEALLFGFEKGAFTGAQVAHAGKFEQAQGGTLLLDEISEMPQSLQSKLLRVLQEREVERLGSTRTIALDVRVIAATNRTLRTLVSEGRFREDLYYRLSVFPLEIPPLRDRTGDIWPLFEHSLRRHCTGTRALPAVTDAARLALCAHHWPGNVRELDNLAQRALVLLQGDVIGPGQLHFGTGGNATLATAPAAADESRLGDALRSRESRLILQALAKGRGSRKSAAELLGISPRTLRYKLSQMRAAGIAIPED